MATENNREIQNHRGRQPELTLPSLSINRILSLRIEKTIDSARVLIVDNLLRDEDDLSEIAIRELGKDAGAQMKQERQIASMALQNIVTNISRLVKQPETEVTHVSTLARAVADFQPNAVVLSGTLRDFDYYKPELLSGFADFIRTTRKPVLGICGGHQLIGLSFGARVITLDQQEQEKRRTNRVTEYQYRFVRIVEPEDPIFAGIDNPESRVWQDYTREGRILRVWQNHGLQLDRTPAGFHLLARSYLCRNQMMVKRSDNQLIYSVQFHLEKSFEDWHKNRTVGNIRTNGETAACFETLCDWPSNTHRAIWL